MRKELRKKMPAQLWAHLFSANGGDWSKPQGWENPCGKPIKFIVKDGSLGILMRIAIIYNYLDKTQNSFFEEARNHSSSKNIKISNHAKLLQLCNEHCVSERFINKRDPDIFFRDGICEILNIKRTGKGLDKIPQSRLFEDDFKGKDAVDRYIHMLESNHFSSQFSTLPERPASMQQPLIRYRAFPDIGKDDIPEVQRIRLALEDTGNDKPMLVNLYAKGQWPELAAWMGWLAEKACAEDPRPVLLIPLIRSPIKPDDNASGRPLERAEILNLSQVIGILHAFVTGGLEAVGAAEPMREEQGLFAMTQTIRLKLAEQPSIIIFDGYHEAHDEFRQLERHVVDDSIRSLIMRLLEPPICCYPERPVDLKRFRRNRIVVTSDKVLDFASAPVVSRFCKPEHILLPSLRHSTLNRTMSAQDVFHIKAEHLKWLDKLRNRPGILVNLMDGYIGIAEGLNQPLQEVKALLGKPEGRPPDELTEAIVMELLKTLNAKPVWRDIFCLIAMTPDGLRPDTIRRFATRTAYLPEHLRPLQELSDCEQAGKLKEEIAALVKAAIPMLGQLRNDAFEGVDNLQHPLEQGLRALFPRMDEQSGRDHNRSIDFLYPEIKFAFRKAIVASLPSELHFHAIHRLLSEEALQQQTISLRHVDGTHMQSIRPWRRMFSTFYHGLQSIPIDRMGDSAQIKDEDFGGREIVSVGPSYEFWRYLYAFCYRRMIERPPAYNLSRLYGLDELKAEILDCFDRPWLLWPKRFREGSKPSQSASLFQSHSTGEESDKALFKDHCLAVAQANIAIGHWFNAEEALKAPLANVALATLDTGRLGLLKRMMEMRLLRGRTFEKLDLEENLEQALGPTQGLIEIHLQKVTDAFVGIVEQGDFLFEEKKTLVATDSLDKLTERGKKMGWSSRDFGNIGDIYLRKAEMFALRADLTSALDKSHGGSLQSLNIPLLNPEIGGPEKIIRDFCRSLALYHFAEQLRLKTFSLYPLGDTFFASGHAVRQATRVAVRLELKTRASASTSGKPMPTPLPLGWFARYARRLADTLSRHLFRYPRERANQFIIEASMLRLLTFENQGFEKLFLARQFLGLAEPIILSLGRHARDHMWLSLERSKLNRALAIAMKESGNDDWRKYCENYQYDVERLVALASSSNSEIWKALAKIQKNKMNNSAFIV